VNWSTTEHLGQGSTNRHPGEWLARDAARDTNRREMAAELVLFAPVDPAELDTLIKMYRLATALDALVEPSIVEEDNVLRLPKHRPGPR
jgi:hypothetical protein